MRGLRGLGTAVPGADSTESNVAIAVAAQQARTRDAMLLGAGAGLLVGAIATSAVAYAAYRSQMRKIRRNGRCRRAHR